MLSIKDITIDAELESLLPPLSEDENIELLKSIQRDGFTDPIIVWLGHNILVDGHNRHRIWTTTGMAEDDAPEIIEKSFTDKNAVKEWMIRHQLARRNLTEGQKAILGLRLKPVLQEKAKANEIKGGQVGGKGKGCRHDDNPIAPVHVDAEIAKATGVHRDTISKVGVVMDHGTNETKAALQDGSISVRKAYRETKATMEPAADEPEPKADDPKKEIKPLGVGVERAHEAIACLKRIPAGDALRKRAFEIVSDWMKHNK